MEFSTFRQSEKAEIRQLFDDVFSESEGQAEGSLVADFALDLMTSTEDEDIFGFVAREKGKIAASIFFSRLTFGAPVEAFILSPVAVCTTYQGKGLGQEIIKYGIEQLKTKGVELVFTYGSPSFYSRVGFLKITEEIVEAPLKMSQPEGWLCQTLVGDEIAPISGRPRCVEALNKPEIW